MTEIRAAISTDIPALIQMSHTVETQYVWQMDYADSDDGLQMQAVFRRVRLPRAVPVHYPREPEALMDTWNYHAETFVVLRADRRVGYARVEERGDIAWVTDCVIDLPWREQGLALELLKFIWQNARRKGFRQMTMEMINKNYPASALAQKLGLDFCGYNDQYYAARDIAIFFGTTLK